MQAKVASWMHTGATIYHETALECNSFKTVLFTNQQTKDLISAQKMSHISTTTKTRAA